MCRQTTYVEIQLRTLDLIQRELVWNRHVGSIVCSAIIIFFLMMPGQSVAQQRSICHQPEAPKLVLQFDDDFQLDSGTNYELQGEVSWQPGKMKLGPQSSVKRQTDGGPWLTLGLEIRPQLPGDAEMTETRVIFYLDGIGTTYLLFRESLETGRRQATVELFEQQRQGLRVAEKKVQISKLPVTIGGKLEIEYRYGYVAITLGGQRVFESCVTHPTAIRDAVTHVEVSSVIGDLEIERISVLQNEIKLLTNEQLNAYAKTFGMVNDAGRFLTEKKYESAAKLGEEILDIQKGILGGFNPVYANSLINVSRLHEDNSDTKLSLMRSQQASTILSKTLGQRHPRYAQNRQRIGDLLAIYLADYRNAEPNLLAAEQIYRQVLGLPHPDHISVLYSLGKTYDSLAQFGKSEGLFNRARDESGRLYGRNHPEYALSLNNLAYLYRSMGDFRKAEYNFQKARQIYEKSVGKINFDYGLATQNLASLYFSIGKYKDAEKLFLEAGDIYRKVYGEENSDTAQVLHNLAALYGEIGEYDRSLELCNEARIIRESLFGMNHPDVARSLNGLASIYGLLGDYSRAEQLRRKSLEIFRKCFGVLHPEYSETLGAMASLYSIMGDYQRSGDLYDQVRNNQLKTWGNKHPGYAKATFDLAAFYNRVQDYGKAKELLIEAIEIQKDSIGESHPEYAASLSSLAYSYQGLGDFYRAQDVYKQVRDLLKDSLGVKHPDYADALGNLAYVYERTRDHLLAGPLLREYRDIKKNAFGKAHPDFATSLINIGHHYFQVGKSQQAEANLFEAINILVSLAKSTIPLFSEAQSRRWMEEYSPPVDAWLSLQRKETSKSDLEVYEVVWNTTALSSRLQRNIRISGSKLSPETRKIANSLREVQLQLARLLTATSNESKSADLVKRFADINARKEVLEQELALSNAPSARDIEIRDASVASLIKCLPPNTAVIDFSLTTHKEVVERNISLKRIDGEIENKQVQKFYLNPVYDTFIIRNELEKQVTWIDLGPAAAIDTEVKNWRRRLTGESGRGLGDQSSKVIAKSHEAPKRLRKLIWEKIEPYIVGCDTVIILPDGDLNRLPWSALPGKNPGSFLIEDYAISTSSYGQQLFECLTNPPVTSSQLLLAGGIDFDSRPNQEQTFDDKPNNHSGISAIKRAPETSSGWPQWDFLSGSQIETEAIEKIWNLPGKIVKHGGENTNELNISVGLGNSRFAHLATHGFFAAPGVTSIFEVDPRKQTLFGSILDSSRSRESVAARNPLILSGLVLSGANLKPEVDDLGIPEGEDGILTGEEIVGLDLSNLELVTLSACDTGLGDVAAGEGVFGLQRAFHQAGARSVIASLWKVDDLATKTLMIEFYKNLWNKKMCKVEALRQAQIRMIKDYDPDTGSFRGLGDKPVKAVRDSKFLSPLFWAAFQLSGDWR